jgi:thiol-disulfide isomerase/thioredoxin
MKKLRLLAAAVALIAWNAGAAAPAFDLVDTQGKRHRLADYHGRWVVLNFWATWCVPCIQEIPEIAQYHRAHRDVVVIGVAIDVDDASKVKRFAVKVGHDYPLVLSDDRVEKELGPMRALPTTRIYDASGTLVYDKAGRVDRKFLEEKIPSRGNDTLNGERPAFLQRPQHAIGIVGLSEAAVIAAERVGEIAVLAVEIVAQDRAAVAQVDALLE